ncbi:hypothetical protein I316_02462 [Kwoniella heveanensis BCC8398]|uniref:Uncharacterized protein n=1 Tax=Kwoniella heveanensis BCC8398 TaxID=1296120 RepID=A0A1B9GY57_9TREE|nr:hypothetical protein I316_02462 [Kwoniella heveanensis BCC8398]
MSDANQQDSSAEPSAAGSRASTAQMMVSLGTGASKRRSATARSIRTSMPYQPDAGFLTQEEQEELDRSPTTDRAPQERSTSATTGASTGTGPDGSTQGTAGAKERATASECDTTATVESDPQRNEAVNGWWRNMRKF